MTIHIEAFEQTHCTSISYVVFDSKTLKGMIIDPSVEFNLYAGSINYQHANNMLNFIDSHHLDIDWILETHLHIDHISAAAFFKQTLGAKVAISKDVILNQRYFTQQLQLDIATDGSQFDHLFNDNEVFNLGEVPVRVLSTPGHSVDSVCYLINGNAFVGDNILMPDCGTPRCDHAQGNASQLFHSIQRVFDLGDDITIWSSHDYQPNGRERVFKSSVANQKKYNIHLKNQTSQHDFVCLRQNKDQQLSASKLLMSAVQVNLNAGQIPCDRKGHYYLKIPLQIN